MKKTDFIQVLADRTGLKADDITSAITSEQDEIELTVSEVHLFNDEQLADRLKNHVEKSKPTILEMAIKDARNTLGLEFEGKTIENLAKAAIEKGKKEAGVKPNEALAEKETIIEKLRQSIIDIEAGKETEVNQWKDKYSKAQINQFVNGMIPDNLDTPLSKKDLATLFKNDINVVEQDGKKVFEKNGEILRDIKTQNPLTESLVIENWLTEKGIKMKSTESGRGEGNTRGNTSPTKIDGIETSEDFYKYCSENKIPQNEQAKLLAEVRKTKSNFYLS